MTSCPKSFKNSKTSMSKELEFKIPKTQNKFKRNLRV